MRYLLILTTLFLSASVLAADGEEKKKPKPLSVEAEVGMMVTSGNTDSTSFAGKLDISQDLKKWKNNYIFSAFYKEDEVVIDDGGPGPDITESQTTADKVFASIQSDYKLDSEHQGLFAYVSYEDDKFSGFDYQATIAVGYSNRLFETDKSWLDYSVGPGMAIARTLETTDDIGTIIPSEKTETFAVRLSGSYVYNFTDNAKFTQKLSSDISGDSDKNTKTKSETGVTATINGSMALKLSYIISHNTQPPFDKEKRDTISAVTLVFTY